MSKESDKGRHVYVVKGEKKGIESLGWFPKGTETRKMNVSCFTVLSRARVPF